MCILFVFYEFDPWAPTHDDAVVCVIFGVLILAYVESPKRETGKCKAKTAHSHRWS